MKQQSKSADKIIECAEKNLYSVQSTDNGFVLSRQSSLFTIIVDFNDEQDVMFALYLRTTSWDWPGERTDLNEIFSILPAAFLRMCDLNISSTLIDIENPAVNIDTEIYARYVVPSQPENFQYMPSGQIDVDIIDSFLASIVMHDMLLWRFMAQLVRGKRDTILDDPDLVGWVETIISHTNETIDSNMHQSVIREYPHWKHFRSIESNISLFESPFLVDMLKAFEYPQETFEGPTAVLFVSNPSSNAVPKTQYALASTILQSLEGSNIIPMLIPLENAFIALGQDNILINYLSCGKKSFNAEKGEIIRRRQDENRVLFPGKKYKWADKIDDDIFEELILVLLKRSPNVKWIRKASSTNEGDQGRDLLAEWDTVALYNQPVIEGEAPITRRKIVIQCKGLARNIGKNDVRDIRDTIEFHDASGFFLVAAKELTNTMVKHLEGLRSKEYWIDWWSRIEIEDKLDQHPDIVAKYHSLVNEVVNG